MPTWIEHVAASLPTSVDPPSVGYPRIPYLRKVISRHVGKKCPAKDIVDRELLCNEAVRLNLVLEREAALPEPKAKKKNSSLDFFDAVNEAGGENAEGPEADDSDEWLDKEDLVRLIATRVEQVAPGDISRKDLMEMCVYLKVVGERQSNIPRPIYKSSEELDIIWREYHDSRKRVWDEEQATLVTASEASRTGPHFESLPKTKRPPRYKAKPYPRPPLPKDRKKMVQACFDLGLITKSDLKNKVVRQDRVDKAAAAKNGQEVTRTTGFARIFRGLPHAQKFREAIEGVTEKLSKLVYQRGFLVWLHLHRVISEEDIAFPLLRGKHLSNFVRRCFTVGTPGNLSDDKDPEILKTLDKYKELFPDLERPSFAGNTMTHAARTYRTAFERHFTDYDMVISRIKRYASSRLFDLFVRVPTAEEDAVDDSEAPPPLKMSKEEEIGKEPIRSIILALGDPEYAVNLHPRQREVLREVRDLLGLPDGECFDKNWLKRNIEASIRMTLKVAKRLDDVREEAKALHDAIEKAAAEDPTASKPRLKKGASKGIKFVPLNGFGRRFVTFDATDIKKLFDLASDETGEAAKAAKAAKTGHAVDEEAGGDDDDDDDDDDEEVQDPVAIELSQALFRDNIRSIFGPKYVDGEYEFTGTISVDAKSEAHFHFRRPLRAGEQKKMPKNASASDARFPVLGQPRDKDKKAETKVKVVTIIEKLKTVPDLVLLVDPGRVHLATITVLWKGKPMMVPRGAKTPGRMKPLVFKISARQYYTLIGSVKQRKVQERRIQKNAGLRAFHSALSETSLKTGNVESIIKYLQVAIKQSDVQKGRWSEALRKRTADVKRSLRIAKEKVLLRFFFSIRRRLKVLTGTSAATVVWGSAKFASSGPGTLSAPTTAVFRAAKRVPSWTIEVSSEYNTSKKSCFAPHADNLLPRFRGIEIEKTEKRPSRYTGLIRGGYIIGLEARRLLRRQLYEKKAHRTKKRPRVYKSTAWVQDGRSDDSDAVKKIKKIERKTSNMKCRYPRGLRICPDGERYVYVDRDCCGCFGIGIIWLANRVEGYSLPDAYKLKKAAKGG